jgi:hypothetical protein
LATLTNARAATAWCGRVVSLSYPCDTALARARLQAANDHVDRPLGLLEGAVGVVRRRWR